ncbi:MAG: lipid-binding SYLF domain-containing protein [Acidobacteriota bacterium]|jgi:lipid-binding SYLF domain-containing protein|nr:lipid-binding SYLF domain-containing protein [Acidobacteriota bacterium]
MRKILPVVVLSCLCAAALATAGDVEDRVVRGAVVLKEIADAPDGGIPQELLDRCACVAVIPGMKKGGFIFGANYGKGLMSCRTEGGAGAWSNPSMFRLEGGSFGFQIGAQSVDLILMVMNLRGIESLLDSKFTLGGDASVAAGPVGRTAAAETDLWMSAEILAYSRARGLFGGLVVKGGTVRQDKDANMWLYQRPVDARTLLLQGAADGDGDDGDGAGAEASPVPEPSPDAAKDVGIFLEQLNKISPPKPKAAPEPPPAALP